MVDLNLLWITISEDDIARIANTLRKWVGRSEHPLVRINPEKLTSALIHSIDFLLSDRFTEGIGRGGWGHSDAQYMKLLYGLEAYNPGKESIMTTAVNVLALHDCLINMDNTGIRINGERPKRLLKSIVDELEGYLNPRWDKKKGHGGVLTTGRDLDSIITPRYRHTAWLFILWYLLPMYHERMKPTALNLLAEFDEIDWRNEKVATAVTAHFALSILEDTPLCEALGADVPASVRHCKNVLERQIEAHFSHELSGWTSGNALQGGRQLYTLFVCAEMAGMYTRPEETLTKQMHTAIEATMQEKWNSSDHRGVPLSPGGPSDISASALAASALMRKPKLTAKEKTFLSNVVIFVVERLAAGQDTIQGTFTWALSYFVRDISKYLINTENK